VSQKTARVENLEKAALRGEPSHVWRFGQNRRLDMIVSLLPIDTRRILEDGCGVGEYVQRLAELGYNTIGLDLEFDRVRDATQKGIEQLHVATGEQLPYPDNTFDALLSHEVIEHVADDRMAAREMIRVLRPGGRVILFCPNRWYPFETHGAHTAEETWPVAFSGGGKGSGRSTTRMTLIVDVLSFSLHPPLSQNPCENRVEQLRLPSDR
jgi:SAM-dependent methyltransferase